MTLKDITIKEEYDSESGDNVHQDFFNEILNESHYYYRIGGNFTSKNFAMCAEGMQKFIENEGSMQLVLTTSFSKEDANAISNGLKNEEDIISENWISSYDEISEKFYQNHTKALSWLLATHKLKIKIVIAYDKNNNILDSDELNQIPIFQRQTGIFMDNSENFATYSGIIDHDNEKFGRYYHLRVNRNWGDDREQNLATNDWIEFQKFWNGEKLQENLDLKIKVIDLPKILEEKLLEIKPASKANVPVLAIPKVLRCYQKQAIANWEDNDKRGVFLMATGTGKTITAIGCISKIISEPESTLIIIACPYSHLIEQWHDSLLESNLKSKITSGDSNWDEKIKDSISALRLGSKYQIIVTSYDLFATDKFIKIIKNCPVRSLLVADEVHHAGSHGTQKGLLPEYTFRLGLTATFERYWDDEGTDVLDKFFDGEVYKKTLEDAIKEKILVGYNYHIIPVEFTPEELINYQKITQDIGKLYYSNDDDRFELLKSKYIIRSKIVANAKNKISALDTLLDDNPLLKKQLLIFTTGRLIEDVKKILIKPKNLFKFREVTHKIPSDKKDRKKIFNLLTSEQIDSIVSIGVLDEGVDIPSANKCIIMSSTGNPKQFIQRRGRVLRRYKIPYPDGNKKKWSDIYDLYVIPKFESDDFQLKDYHKNLVGSQLKRLTDMANLARNKEDCLEIISDIESKFKN